MVKKIMKAETTKILEMPAYLFDLVVSTAHQMFNLDTKWEEPSEDVPAVKWLCDWWNIRPPAKVFYRSFNSMHFSHY
jgi:hypothetical protein